MREEAGKARDSGPFSVLQQAPSLSERPDPLSHAAIVVATTGNGCPSCCREMPGRPSGTANVPDLPENPVCHWAAKYSALILMYGNDKVWPEITFSFHAADLKYLRIPAFQNAVEKGRRSLDWWQPLNQIGRAVLQSQFMRWARIENDSAYSRDGTVRLLLMMNLGTVSIWRIRKFQAVVVNKAGRL